jgi:hypothetical protein
MLILKDTILNMFNREQLYESILECEFDIDFEKVRQIVDYQTISYKPENIIETLIKIDLINLEFIKNSIPILALTYEACQLKFIFTNDYEYLDEIIESNELNHYVEHILKWLKASKFKLNLDKINTTILLFWMMEVGFSKTLNENKIIFKNQYLSTTQDKIQQSIKHLISDIKNDKISRTQTVGDLRVILNKYEEFRESYIKLLNEE